MRLKVSGQSNAPREFPLRCFGGRCEIEAAEISRVLVTVGKVLRLLDYRKGPSTQTPFALFCLFSR